MFFTPVSEIANTDVALLEDAHSVNDGLELMTRDSKHALVIMGDAGLRVMSTHILISLRFAGLDFTTPLRDVGLPMAECLQRHQVLAEGAVTYSRARSELLCVVDGDTLLGVITSDNIIRYMKRYAPDIRSPVRELPASRDYVRADAGTPLKQAVLKMQTAGHTSILIFRQKDVVGIVSYSDILPALNLDAEQWQRPVSDFMTSPVIHISEDCLIQDVLISFCDSHLKRLAISDQKHRITGLIYQREIIAQVYDVMKEERHQQVMLQELSDNEQRWRAVLEGTGQGVWDWNAQTGKVYYSPVWKSMLGFEEHEVGDTINEWQTRIHPDDLERTYRDVDAHLKGETSIYDNTHRVLCKGGRYKWIRDIGKVFSRDAQGNPIRVIGSHTDITEEIELKEKLSLLADNAPGMLYQYRIDAEGGVSFPFATRGCKDVYGFSPQELKSDVGAILDRIHREDIERISASIEVSKESLAVWEEQYRYDHPIKGLRWIEGRAVPSRMSDGSVIWNGYIYDITERKMQEFALEAARKMADDASRAKSEFLANMSHEIRTPMSGIIGLSQISVGEQRLDVLHERLYKIHHSGRLLLGILNDILDYSKIESGKLGIECQPFFIDGLLDNLRSLFAMEADKKQLELIFDSAPELAIVYMGDELRIRQVLTNLLGNAIKFTEKGQVRLTVALCNDRPSNPKGQQWLHFSIQDTGIGVTAGQKDKLFNAFSQADTSIARKHGGSGLGLVISQRLVEAMQGRGITLESEPGKGACFSFELPLSPCSSAQEKEFLALQPQDEDVIGSLAGHILLVEDNLINQEITQSQLKQLGLDVTLAENGQEALDLLGVQTFDLVLMDIQMPVMDGYTATRTLRAMGNKLPVIALTAAAMAEDQQRAADAGMNGHLTKPIETYALFHTLSHWLQPQEVLSDKLPEVGLSQVSDSGSEPPSLPPVISGDIALFDPAEGVAMVGGQYLIYQKILQEFTRQLSDEYMKDVALMELLSEKSAPEEFLAAHRITHSIKGVAGNLCMRPLAEAAAELDQELKRNRPPGSEQLQIFQKLLAQSYTEVNAWLLTQQEAVHASSDSPFSLAVNAGDHSGVSEVNIIARLQVLMAEILNSQFIDESELEEITGELKNHNKEDADVLWKTVTQALNQFDFELAASALQRLLNKLESAS